MVSQQERPVSTAPDNLFTDGIAAALGALSAETPPEPSDVSEYDAPEPEEEEQDEAPAEDEQEPEEEQQAEAEPAEKPRARHSVSEWANILLTDGEQRLSEIPPRLHAEVFAAFKAEHAKQVANQTQQVISAQLRQERALRDYIAQVDEHFSTDPDGKLQWLENDPNGKYYIDGKRYLQAIDQQSPEEHVASVSALGQRAQRQFARLNGFSELQAELRSRDGQGRYPATEEGIAQLEADVDQLLADAARGNVGRPQNGNGTPTRTARRPLVTGTSGPKPASTAPDISKIRDPYELMTMGVEQQSRRLRARA